MEKDNGPIVSAPQTFEDVRAPISPSLAHSASKRARGSPKQLPCRFCEWTVSLRVPFAMKQLGV